MRAANQFKFTTLTRSLFSVFLALILQLPTSPQFYPYPERDSGVFLYTGWRILNGELPYVAVWDHKPPMVFLINAIGLKLGGGSYWGVWAIKVISLALSIYIIFLLLEKYFGPLTAIITNIVWVVNLPPILRLGNFTTEYTIPLQAMALFLTSIAIEKSNKHFLRFFVIGLLGGLTFMTKQSAIGLWLAIGIFLVVEGIVKKTPIPNLSKLAGIAVGALSVILLTATFFASQGAFAEFFDQTIKFNYFYVQRNYVDMFNRILALLNPKELRVLPVFYMAGLGAIIGLSKSLEKTKFSLPANLKKLIMIAAIDILIEILLVNMPYTTYSHYLLTFCVTMAFFTGFLLSIFFETFSGEDKLKTVQQSLTAILIVLFVSFPYLERWDTSLRERNRDRRQETNVLAIDYVLHETDSDDSILIWGAETAVNFYTKRTSPTRYVYQYPLTSPGYTSRTQVIEFLSDLKENSPELIIDSNRSDMPFFVFAEDSDEIELLRKEVLSNYSEEIEIDGWIVYRLNNQG